MNYNMYATGRIVQDMLDERKREATKQRQWAQALRAKRGQTKS